MLAVWMDFKDFLVGGMKWDKWDGRLKHILGCTCMSKQ